MSGLHTAKSKLLKKALRLSFKWKHEKAGFSETRIPHYIAIAISKGVSTA